MSDSDGAPLRVVAFAGSLRRGSFNKVVLRSAVAHSPSGLEIAPIDISDVPLFDGDVEIAGDPSSVLRVKDAVRSSDALLVVTPEYNSSVSAVTKNTIDWLSRKREDGTSAMTGKPVAIASASPGGRGGLGAREHLSHVVGRMTDSLFPETLGIPNVRGAVDDAGELSDSAVVGELAGWLARFRDHIGGR